MSLLTASSTFGLGRRQWSFFHGIVTCFAPYYALSYSQSDMKQGDSCEFFSVKGICKIAFLKIPKSVTDEDTVG